MTEDAIQSISSLLKELKGVKVGKHLNNANFLVGKKVFAFIKRDSVALKLPKEKIMAISGDKDIAPLVMGKRTMKEWVVIKRKNAEDYKKDLDLFKESIRFVSGK